MRTTRFWSNLYHVHSKSKDNQDFTYIICTKRLPDKGFPGKTKIRYFRLYCYDWVYTSASELLVTESINLPEVTNMTEYIPLLVNY